MYLVRISNHGCISIEWSVKHNQNCVRVRTCHVVSINISLVPRLCARVEPTKSSRADHIVPDKLKAGQPTHPWDLMKEQKKFARFTSANKTVSGQISSNLFLKTRMQLKRGYSKTNTSQARSIALLGSSQTLQERLVAKSDHPIPMPRETPQPFRCFKK